MSIKRPANGVERVFLIPDLHCDDHDSRAVSLAAQICSDFKPHRVIFLGDVIDTYWATSFPSDIVKTMGSVEKELSAWEETRRLFKAPLVQMVPGNHELRILRNWLWLAPAFRGWLPANLPEFLRLGKEVEFVQRGIIELAQGAFLVTHGRYACKRAGQSAFQEMAKYGCSGVTGHSHRLATYLQRDYRGLRSWTEAGHLSSNPPHYGTFDKPGPEDWQQGVVALEIEGDRYHVETIPFTLGYRCLFRGRRYQA